MVGRVYPTEIRPYLTRMETEDIATVAAEAYELIEEDAKGGLMDTPKPGSGVEPRKTEMVLVNGQYLPVEDGQTYVVQQQTSKRYGLYLGPGHHLAYINVDPIRKTGQRSSRPPFWTHASGWDVVGIAHLSLVFQPPPPPKPRHNFLSAGGELTRPCLASISSMGHHGRTAADGSCQQGKATVFKSMELR
jgi:hypothetical protein